MKHMKLAALAMALPLFASACSGGTGNNAGPSDEGDPVTGGRVALQVKNEPVPLDPLLLVAPTDRMIAANIYEPLVELNPDGELSPVLATSWESDDAKTWTVELRDGVTFTDGEPFDSDAVVANVERARSSSLCSTCETELAFIKSITPEDANTLVFELAAPAASFPAYLSNNYFSMASPKAIEKYGDKLAEHPTGTGPFTLAKKDAQGLSFTKNPDYWDDGKPYLDGVDYKIIPDSQAAIAALQTGDVDILTTTDDTTNTQAAGIPDAKVISVEGVGAEQVFFNAKKAPFDDEKARRAIVLATDREALLKIIHPGGADYEMVDSPWGSGMPVAGDTTTSEKHPGHDLEEARKLVKELGGLKFNLLTYNVGHFSQIAQALQSQWKEAGIEVDIDLQDVNTAISNSAAYRHQAFLTSWSGRSDPDMTATRYLHSSRASSTGINDAELDRLIEQGRTTLDPAERAKIYQQVVDRVSEVLPAMYYDGLMKTSVVSTRVGGADMTPEGLVLAKGLWSRK